MWVRRTDGEVSTRACRVRIPAGSEGAAALEARPGPRPGSLIASPRNDPTAHGSRRRPSPTKANSRPVQPHHHDTAPPPAAPRAPGAARAACSRGRARQLGCRLHHPQLVWGTERGPADGGRKSSIGGGPEKAAGPGTWRAAHGPPEMAWPRHLRCRRALNRAAMRFQCGRTPPPQPGPQGCFQRRHS